MAAKQTNRCPATIVCPTDEAWNEMRIALALQDDQMASLRAAVGDAIATLDAWNSEAAVRSGIGDARKFSERITNLLKRLDHLIVTNPTTFASVLANERPGLLSHHLSFAACEAAIGSDAFASAFPPEVLERSRIRLAKAEGDLVNIEANLPEKGYLEDRHSVDLARRTIKVLREPFDAHLERKNQGGRPRDIARTALILHLALNSTRIIGVKASAGEKSAFLNLCNQVTFHCGINEDGLQDATKLILDHHKPDIDWASLSAPALKEKLSEALNMAAEGEDEEPGLV